MFQEASTIVALSTPPGAGAIGVVRLSGPGAIDIAAAIFEGKDLAKQKGTTIHFGRIVERPSRPGTDAATGASEFLHSTDGNPEDISHPLPSIGVNHEAMAATQWGEAPGWGPLEEFHNTDTQRIHQPVSQSTVIDEVVVSLFRAPNSYTGEDVAEISCHGSPYILQQVIMLCCALGAVPARPGEFTQRAFLNGKLDLTQAEAVGDLIAGESAAAHRSAMHQMRGGFSKDLKAMREELITFAALIELELDFSEEDVAFADRVQLDQLLVRISHSTSHLISSFALGNAVKTGVSVAITGAPNSGKSTLLNALLNEERAIVSEIAGTTRDTIEEVININGILFRFIDTAGIREHTEDAIEQQGIARSLQKAAEADVVIDLIDGAGNISAEMQRSGGRKGKSLLVLNKMDTVAEPELLQQEAPDAVLISAKNGDGIDSLKARLSSIITSQQVHPGSTIITNTRHLAALKKIREAVLDIREGLSGGLSGDLLSHHIRQALHQIGELTGDAVQTDRDVLGAIFGKFCIGK